MRLIISFRTEDG